METKRGKPGDKDDSSSRLELHLGYWLRRVSNYVSGTFVRALGAQQTSAGEWVVMCTLSEQPEISSAALADTLGLTRGAVSKILDKLEAKSWTTRKTKPQDNRVQLLSLTKQGCRALPKLVEIADQNDQRFFDCLETEERATLLRLLQKLADFHHIWDVPIE